MHELIRGMWLWDMTVPRTEKELYTLLFCQEGQIFLCSGEICVSVLPGQCILLRPDILTDPPIALTGRENRIGLLLNMQELQQSGTEIASLSALPECGYRLCTDEHISMVWHTLLCESSSSRMKQLKAAELLLLFSESLSSDAPLVCKREEFLTVTQAYHFAMEHLQERVTISQMAQQTGKSPTMLKICFRHACGDSVYAFLRKEKMHRAAEMLIVSNQKIIDIAGKLGYDNCSKFSVAFSKIMG
ncbi:MAG: helix-turn-helix domain-containing protein, partial [Oscillospiraceae bacterium]|nr:helix-turn-helix domain-containing protein [Oscillospiraceae bacterium]